MQQQCLPAGVQCYPPAVASLRHVKRHHRHCARSAQTPLAHIAQTQPDMQRLCTSQLYTPERFIAPGVDVSLFPGTLACQHAHTYTHMHTHAHTHTHTHAHTHTHTHTRTLSHTHTLKHRQGRRAALSQWPSHRRHHLCCAPVVCGVRPSRRDPRE